MMLTRCPHAECQTAFRVTPEQLKARGGKVRCGRCQQVFNALDHLIDEGEATEALVPAAAPMAPLPAAAAPSPLAMDTVTPPPQESATPLPEELDPEIDDEGEDFPEILLEAAEPSTAEPPPTAATRQEPVLDLAAITPPSETPVLAEPVTADAADAPPLGAEDLILPRETTAIPGYSKWAERPLAGSGPLMADPIRKPRWPFGVAIGLLLISLLGQISHYFRSELAAHLPFLQPTMLALGWNIPLPRRADQVSIEASDLQADVAKGQLVLLATLKNRAAYAQDLPALELALTDTQDAVVARRVLQPADYLSPGTATTTFPANGEIAVKLWIATKDLVPSGYRLYVFYP